MGHVRKILRVLLSTYNGERFLGEQLESILNQSLYKNPEWSVELVIRDDGSSDSTRDILSEYEKRDRVSCIYGENVGVTASFFELIKHMSEGADYIALSDQDDVWMEDKLESAVQALEKEKSAEPLLYCGMCQITDEQLSPIETVFFTDHIRPSFGNALVENICTGCTAVFNQSLAALLRVGKPDFTVMHDWWIYIYGACFGKVVHDGVPHMYYRQHGNNTVGVQKSYLSEFVARVKRFRGNRYNISRQIASFQKLCKEHNLPVPEENRELMGMVLTAKRKIRARFRLMHSKKIYRQRRVDNIIFKMIFLSGTM